MDFKIAVLPGDGIGPEISKVGVDVMTAVCNKMGHKVEYSYAPVGAIAIDETRDPFPESTFNACMNADAVLFSAIGGQYFICTSSVLQQRSLHRPGKQRCPYRGIRTGRAFRQRY